MRCVTWNISGAVLTSNNAPEGLTTTDSLGYVGNCLAELNADIVCLQEVPFLPDEPEFASALAGRLGFSHFVSVPISPSHLHDNARLGLSVLSRYAIRSSETIQLPNPNVTVRLPDGRAERSHDKAMLIARLDAGDHECVVACVHLPPFRALRRHPGEPMFEPLRRALSAALMPLLSEPFLLLGDVNTDTIGHVLPELQRAPGVTELIRVPTRVDGSACDQIVCSAHWTPGFSLVIPTWSDHHLCVTDASRAVSAGSQAIPPTRTAPEEPLQILHLSDLHLGAGSKEDVDWKVYLKEADRVKQAEWLDAFVRALPRCPDYVVVSGDLTIGGRADGFADFTKLVTSLIDGGRFPPVDRILVVPGNHDVTRLKNGRPAAGAERWEAFKQTTDRHVRPWMLGDPNPAEVEAEFKRMMMSDTGVWGGVSTRHVERTGLQTRTHIPVLFDRERHVLFYAFNSASVAGTQNRAR